MLPTGRISDQLAVNLGGVQALRASARAGDPEALKAAAKQFEALFVQTMLKTMRETRFSAEGDVYADSSSLKLYQELLDQQWAQKMVDGKGFGFADLIAKRLTLESGAQVGNPAPDTTQAVEEAVVGATQTRPSQVPSFSQEVGQTTEKAPNILATPTAEATPASSGQDRKQHFLETMRPHAEAAEQATGIPARFILAHAALESGWGKREILTDDGTTSHNLFGIKAGASWSGASAEIQTTEYRHGLPVTVTDSFRAYGDYGAAFTDYAKLLRRRYSDALAAGEDAQAFANALVKGGYATDPAYASKLQAVIRTIEVAGA